MPPRKQITYSQRPTHAARAAHARGERQFRTYDTSLIRPKRSKGPLIFALILAVFVIGGLVWGGVTLYDKFVGTEVELLADGEEVTITVEEGSGASTIAQQLVDARLISTKTEFTTRVNDLGLASSLKPGTYTFVGGTALDDIISALETGPVAENTLTIPEGYTLASIADAVAEVTEGEITAEEFVEAASDASVYAADYSFLEDVGTNSLEGFLFPKTYEISDDATADSIICMMLNQFETEISALDWSYPESQGLTIYDAVNLASIVEKESSGDELIRAQVAAVFYNRLSTDGDPSYGFLQSDATTAYEVGHDPSAEEVHEDTPYSTYTNTGLPPTPICSPGLDCLMAVCEPDEDALGTYFFFYFTDDEYFFSETYDEHMATFS